MCTPGDDSILIIGTVHGSIQLYDLKEFDMGNTRNEELNFEALLNAKDPESRAPPDSDDYQNQLLAIRNRYNI